MYKAYWRLKYLPFQNVPDPKFFFPSSIHKEAVAKLRYIINSNKGVGLLTGPIGSGKTLVSRTLLNTLSNDGYEVGLITNPSLPAIDFLKEINHQLGIVPFSDSKGDLLRSFNEKLVSNFKLYKETILIIDEVQVIKDEEIWEELRLFLNFQLNNRFLTSLILMGQPEVNKTILELKQLDQRIALKHHLTPFDLDETKRYILFRLKKSGAKRGIFTDKAIKLIYDSSGGIPREINKMCDLSLLNGYFKKRELIDSFIVEKVFADFKTKRIGIYSETVRDR